MNSRPYRLARSPWLRCLFIPLLALALVPAHAVVPEPGNLFYGLARDMFGQPLSPDSDALVLMVRTVGTNDVVMAVSEILPTPDSGEPFNYVLRPTLDDGVGARFSAEAGRSNDVVQIFVVLNGFRYPVTNNPACIAFSDPIPRLGGRAEVKRANLRANDDFDQNCLSDSWEIASFGNTGLVARADDDLDGYSNLSEFLMGTNAGDPASHPGNVAELRVLDGVPNQAVFAWPRFQGVADSLLWSAQANGTYSNIPPHLLSGSSTNTVNLTGRTNMFFRVRYDLPQ